MIKLNIMLMTPFFTYISYMILKKINEKVLMILLNTKKVLKKIGSVR
jgi:hypothetical protein